MENKHKADDGKEGNSFSNDFKVALSAIVSDEDYKALESQFLGRRGNKEH